MKNLERKNTNIESLLSDDLFVDRNKKKEFISSSFIHKLQLRHFLLFNIAPPTLALAIGLYLYSSSQS